MSDNQYVFEIIRDVGYAIQRIKENETLWLNVKNDGRGFFTARGTDHISGGLSETSRAIEKAYKVTRGVPDSRDVEINELKKTVNYLDAKIKSAMCCHESVVQVLLDEAKQRTHLNT